MHLPPAPRRHRSRLGRREAIGAATVERYFRYCLKRQFSQWHPPRCPAVLGIDEHFFTRRKGYATTLCDLRNHKIYDVVLGRSESSLDAYLARLEGKSDVRVVCRDLAPAYRALVRKHFPNAHIVADRFHVIRIINHHFLACWRELDPRLLRAIYQLRQAGLPQLVQLGETLHSWSTEIATMWRFTRNNGITEGLHNKMELTSRQAYGFRNFENYRLRVKVLCSEKFWDRGSPPLLA
jgi:transposase